MFAQGSFVDVRVDIRMCLRDRVVLGATACLHVNPCALLMCVCVCVYV